MANLWQSAQLLGGSTAQWVRRNKRKLAFGAAALSVAGGAYYVFQLAKDEAARLDALQRRRAKMREHFHRNQMICQETASSLLPSIQSWIDESIDIESVYKILKDGRGTMKSQEKTTHWVTLTQLSFLRTCTVAYAVTLLDLVLHIELNIIGRYHLNDSLKGDSDQNGSSQPTISWETQEKFLSLTEHILKHGLQSMKEHIASTVNALLTNETIDLKKDVTASDVCDVLSSLRTQFEMDIGASNEPNVSMGPGPDHSHGVSPLINYLLPPEESDDVGSPELKPLIEELRDTLECADFHTVVKGAIENVFATLMRSIQRGIQAKIEALNSASGVGSSGGSERTALPFAHVVSIVKDASIAMLEPSHENNSFLKSIASVDDLESFCYIIYSATDAN